MLIAVAAIRMRDLFGVVILFGVYSLLTAALFMNLDDPSALAQLVANYDMHQDLQLLAAINLPLGPDGSEYGGIESPIPDEYLSTGPALFMQLAWYF